MWKERYSINTQSSSIKIGQKEGLSDAEESREVFSSMDFFENLLCISMHMKTKRKENKHGSWMVFFFCMFFTPEKSKEEEKKQD